MSSQRIKFTSQEIRKYLWHTSKFLCINKTGKYLKILNLIFSIKDGIKSVSSVLLVFDISRTTLCISCPVNGEFKKTVDKETKELQLTMSLTAACC